MNLLEELGSVTGTTKGATICGRVLEGVCANFGGILYHTYLYVEAPCAPRPC